MVTLAADGVTFLFAWEIMAISAFFLVSTEDHKPEAWRAGWVYLVAAHVGTLCLFALFALLRTASGSFELTRVHPTEAGLGLQVTIFLIALAGFGLKAGAFPLHFWLPTAHAAAPSHVSAMLSAVVLKVGIYGLVRITMLLPALPVVCGLMVLVVGVVSAVLGVTFALGQHDLKRLLAYHSIENIGIILIGLGLAMVGLAAHRSEWIVLGMAGCLLHVWNHGFFKALLFFAAGAVVHAAHTREIDHLGGLAKRMPRSAALFAIGAVAICGLPPLNGFVSELLIYLGLFRAATEGQAGLSSVALAAPALALVGALAVACFVKAYGAVFLGMARTPAASDAHEVPLSMVAPMALLAAICVAIGVLPILVLPLLNRAVLTWAGVSEQSLQDLVPYGFMTTLSIALIIAVAATMMLMGRRSLWRPVHEALTWDCGYARPRGAMQYTSSSFASTLVGIFSWVLRPCISCVPPKDVFPGRSEFESHVPDIVLDGFLNPFWSRVKSWLAPARVLQQGRVQRYLFYILLTLFGLLLSMVPLTELARRLLGR
jgi:hydrogenase-4 component B